MSINKAAIEPIVGGIGANGTTEIIVGGALAGAYSLPEGAAEAIRAFNQVSRMWQASRVAPPTDKDNVRVVADALVKSLLAGDEPQDAGDLMLQAEFEQRKAELRYKALGAARDLAAGNVERLLSEAALVPELRKSLEATLAEARALPKDTPTTIESALDAGEAGAAAYRRLKALVERHQSIRTAQAACRTGQAAGRRDGLFFDCQDEPEATDLGPKGSAARPAGPGDPTQRLLWLAREGKPWLPTLAEEEAAFAGWRGPVARRKPHFSTVW